MDMIPGIFNFTKKRFASNFYTVVKRFFLIASAIFIIVWIPLLAATAGLGKQFCGKGISASYSNSVEHLTYSQNTETSQGEFQQQGNVVFDFPEQGYAKEQEVQHKKQAVTEQREKLQPDVVQPGRVQPGVSEFNETKVTSVQMDRNENAPSEQQALPPVSENNRNTQDSISDNFSFNFLYYLFYKFSLSDFFKNS